MDKAIEKRFIEEFNCTPQDYRNKHGEPLFLKAVRVVETLIEREQVKTEKKRYIEESRRLTREELEERITDLIRASERQSKDFDLLLKTKIDLHNLLVDYFEATKKANDKIMLEWKQQVENFGKIIEEFVSQTEHTKKVREKYLEKIEVLNKKTETLNRAILAYNDKATALDARYKTLLARLHKQIDEVNKLRGAY